MSFKDMIEKDNKSVFLNINEFADTHTVQYNGNVYNDIPVVLTKVKESKKTVIPSVEGIYHCTAVAHMALADLGNHQPEQGNDISISDGTALGNVFYKQYKIVTSDCEMGMVVLELEAYDE